MAINKTVNQSTKSHGAMKNVLEYVLRDTKTKDFLVTVTGPYEEDTIRYDMVYQSFLKEKRMWGKDSGRMYAHNIISFHKDETITPDEAFDFGKEFAEQWFEGFQTVVVVHQDKEHIHIHLVTNTVSFQDGHKLHTTKHDMERMKKLTNAMCRKRGLGIAEKGKHFDGRVMESGEVIAWSKDKYRLLANEYKSSYLADCAIAVMNVMEDCTSREQFIRKMQEQGWNTIWEDNKKHITFINGEGKRVRGSNLAKTFRMDVSKEGMEREFERQKERNILCRETDGELAEYQHRLEDTATGKILSQFAVASSIATGNRADTNRRLGELESAEETARKERKRSESRKENSAAGRTDREAERKRFAMAEIARKREAEQQAIENIESERKRTGGTTEKIRTREIDSRGRVR